MPRYSGSNNLNINKMGVDSIIRISAFFIKGPYCGVRGFPKYITIEITGIKLNTG